MARAQELIVEDGGVIDGNGVVHRVVWVDRMANDFTIACLAKLFLVNTPYYEPTRERPNCVLCLAERL